MPLLPKRESSKRRNEDIPVNEGSLQVGLDALIRALQAARYEIIGVIVGSITSEKGGSGWVGNTMIWRLTTTINEQ